MPRYRRLFLLPLDIALVAFSRFAAYWIRFEGEVPAHQERFFWVGFAVAVCVVPAYFFYSGFYRRLWRYASIPDLVHIVKATFLASVTSTVITLFLLRDPDYSRSVPILSWMILTALILARSLAWRLFHERRNVHKERSGVATLIVGAGLGGKTLLQEIRQSGTLPYNVVGFVDDDPRKQGGEINGRPVLGTISDLVRIARERNLKKVIIAIPSAPSKLIRRVVRTCQRAGLDVGTLPAIGDMLDRQHLAAQVRPVNLEDLLGRDPVRLDVGRIEAYLKGRRILVTGAGGSIGSEICRQVAKFEPECLILFELAETPLHHISLELSREFPELDVQPMLGDIRNRDQVDSTFRQFKPEVVFHAAACKHVPMMEHHPLEAVKTNVLGSRNLAEAADAEGVERFVMISTDKAVNPTNVMGTSKRAAELFVQAFNLRSATEFITVRFGNVLGSNGSVVPLFQEQIHRGGPVTVTHPDVTRFFMTIPEASQLVLQAGSMGKGGEILLLEMGDPVKIADLAEDLIRLSGLEPGKDIDIVFTGLRPGEKLYEELLIEGEGVKPTEHRKIRVANARTADLEEVERALEALEFCVRKGDDELAVQTLSHLVPEYRPTNRPAKKNLAIHPAAMAPAAET